MSTVHKRKFLQYSEHQESDNPELEPEGNSEVMFITAVCLLFFFSS